MDLNYKTYFRIFGQNLDLHDIVRVLWEVRGNLSARKISSLVRKNVFLNYKIVKLLSNHRIHRRVSETNWFSNNRTELGK